MVVHPIKQEIYIKILLIKINNDKSKEVQLEIFGRSS